METTKTRVTAHYIRKYCKQLGIEITENLRRQATKAKYVELIGDALIEQQYEEVIRDWQNNDRSPATAKQLASALVIPASTVPASTKPSLDPFLFSRSRKENLILSSQVRIVPNINPSFSEQAVVLKARFKKHFTLEIRQVTHEVRVFYREHGRHFLVGTFGINTSNKPYFKIAGRITEIICTSLENACVNLLEMHADYLKLSIF